MRLKEQRLWDSMSKHAAAPSPLAPILVERVENMATDGMPDVRAHVQGGSESWIELKAVNGWPARSTTPVLGREGLRLAQENWIHRHVVQFGGRALILVGVGRGAGRVLYGIEGAHAMDVNFLTQEQMARAAVVRDWPGLMDWIREGRA